MKAILVIDVPEEYELDQLAVNYILYSVEGKILDGDMGRELKPMPEPMPKDNSNEVNLGFELGWNNCLEEIENG